MCKEALNTADCVCRGPQTFEFVGEKAVTVIRSDRVLCSEQVFKYNFLFRGEGRREGSHELHGDTCMYPPPHMTCMSRREGSHELSNFKASSPLRNL